MTLWGAVWAAALPACLPVSRAFSSSMFSCRHWFRRWCRYAIWPSVSTCITQSCRAYNKAHPRAASLAACHHCSAYCRLLVVPEAYATRHDLLCWQGQVLEQCCQMRTVLCEGPAQASAEASCILFWHLQVSCCISDVKFCRARVKC